MHRIAEAQRLRNRLAALHRGVFQARGPYFRERLALVALHPAGFPALADPRAAVERQSLIVGPDGDPGLPSARGPSATHPQAPPPAPLQDAS